jgi:hypothetical protein
VLFINFNIDIDSVISDQHTTITFLSFGMLRANALALYGTKSENNEYSAQGMIWGGVGKINFG